MYFSLNKKLQSYTLNITPYLLEKVNNKIQRSLYHVVRQFKLVFTVFHWWTPLILIGQVKLYPPSAIWILDSSECSCGYVEWWRRDSLVILFVRLQFSSRLLINSLILIGQLLFALFFSPHFLGASPFASRLYVCTPSEIYYHWPHCVRELTKIQYIFLYEQL